MEPHAGLRGGRCINTPEIRVFVITDLVQDVVSAIIVGGIIWLSHNWLGLCQRIVNIVNIAVSNTVLDPIGVAVADGAVRVPANFRHVVVTGNHSAILRIGDHPRGECFWCVRVW